MNPQLHPSIFNQFPIIESERLRFRPYKKEDAPYLYELKTDERSMQYMDSPKYASIQQAEEVIQQAHLDFEAKKGIKWAIELKATQQFIGDFGIWRVDMKNARGEIGYALLPDYWRKGYMKETHRSLLNFGFQELGLHSYEANVNLNNVASQQLLIQLGFRLEAHFRENYYFDGQFLDSYIYCLLEKDFVK